MHVQKMWNKYVQITYNQCHYLLPPKPLKFKFSSSCKFPPFSQSTLCSSEVLQMSGSVGPKGQRGGKHLRSSSAAHGYGHGTGNNLFQEQLFDIVICDSKIKIF